MNISSEQCLLSYVLLITKGAVFSPRAGILSPYGDALTRSMIKNSMGYTTAYVISLALSTTLLVCVLLVYMYKGINLDSEVPFKSLLKKPP